MRQHRVSFYISLIIMEKPLFKKKHFNTPGHAHELTFSCYRRRRYFENEKVCEIFMEELEKTKVKYEFKLWAYVIMPNQIHLLIWPQKPDYDISKIMQDLKSKSALRSSRILKNAWQHHEEDKGFRF